jgi:hypothetical protein
MKFFNQSIIPANPLLYPPLIENPSIGLSEKSLLLGNKKLAYVNSTVSQWLAFV